MSMFQVICLHGILDTVLWIKWRLPVSTFTVLRADTLALIIPVVFTGIFTILSYNPAAKTTPECHS